MVGVGNVSAISCIPSLLGGGDGCALSGRVISTAFPLSWRLQLLPFRRTKRDGFIIQAGAACCLSGPPLLVWFGTAQELMVAAFEHLEGDGHQPYAFGHCTECGRLIIGWSAYQWPIVVQEPCPKCGKPW